MLRLDQVRLDHPDALALTGKVQAEYVVLYGSPDESPIDPAMFDPPDGAFFVGYLGDRPVTMGGWKRRPDLTRLGGTDVAEIKRMYVAPDGRRRGLARAVLGHLEETARAAGIDVLVLETGTMQPAAIALYESSGYELVDAYGHYARSPLSRCFGKRLGPGR